MILFSNLPGSTLYLFRLVDNKDKFQNINLYFIYSFETKDQSGVAVCLIFIWTQ